MTGPEVDSFSARLSRELATLSWDRRNELLVQIGKMELRMRAAGQERPIWRGPVPENKILGADVVIPTEQGERRGRVICFGVMPVGSDGWERSVIVHVPSSGTQHEGPGSQARLASPEDSMRIANEIIMAQRLSEAAEHAQRGADPESAQRRVRKRGARDPGLVEQMLNVAKQSKRVTSVEEGTTNYKITGTTHSRKIYLFKSQLRVDLSGFSVDHAGVRKISEEEARDMHLGKVRGQLLFDDRDVAIAAFESALGSL